MKKTILTITLLFLTSCMNKEAIKPPPISIKDGGTCAPYKETDRLSGGQFYYVHEGKMYICTPYTELDHAK